MELTVTGVVAGGDGLARDEGGKIVFVEGAVPGDRVRVEITVSKRDFNRARVVDAVEPSADRVEPPCPFVAAGCGGCQWQHAAYINIVIGASNILRKTNVDLWICPQPRLLNHSLSGIDFLTRGLQFKVVS